MIRTILAVLAGLLVAMTVIIAMQWLAMSWFPPPEGFVLDDESDLAHLIEIAPQAMFLAMLLGWMLSSFAGGWIAARIATHKKSAAIIVGTLIVAGLAFTVWQLPYPRWVALANVLLPIPITWLAAMLATRNSSSTRSPH